MAKSDTISFINLNGELRVFVVKKFDSVLVNSSGPFSPIPYKDISFEYDELPKSLTSLKRNNEVFISKSGCSNKTAISIKFENMWFYDSILPPPYRKSITLGKISFEPTYVLENPASLPYNNDVRALYLSVIYGIQGFETGKGEKWISCRLLPRCP